MVPVEVVVIGHEALDGVEVDHDVLELARDEEARGHALAPGDGVAFGGARADDLEELLRDADVLAAVAVEVALAHQRHDCGLEDVLARVGWFEVFHQVVGFDDFIVVQVVDDQIVLGLLDPVQERGQHLKRIFSIAEHHQVVFNDLVFLDDGAGFVENASQFGLSSPPAVLEEVVARLQVAGLQTVRKTVELVLQELSAHFIVLQFVVAERDVVVQRVEVLFINNDAFVDVDGFILIFALEVHGGHAEQVL